MSTAFADVKPFPGQPNPRAVIGGNKPPLEDVIVAEFVESLRSEDGLLDRIDELVSKGRAAGACDSEERAGRYGDFVKMAGVAAKAVEQIRDRHNRPILTAQRALKGKADAIVAPLTEAVNNVRKQLDAFMAEQRRKAAEEARRLEEQRQAALRAAEEERQRQIEAARANGEIELPAMEELGLPAVTVAPVEVEKPAVRGDYGSRVGSQIEWKHEIVSVRQLPDAVLKHPTVIEALDKVLRARVRGGEREIKGCRIFSVEKTVVR